MKMPVLFVGHGSPMNAIEENKFTRVWREIGEKLPKPKAILAISAHWYTDGTLTNDAEHPEMIYDMYGFPDALYALKYPAKGSKTLAEDVKTLLGSDVRVDNGWGIDHGTWSVLVKMFPEANIPVVQLSVNHKAPAQAHFDLGLKLRTLREQGVLILASGNIVHNLSLINWDMPAGYPWAHEFDAYIKKHILDRHYQAAIDYRAAGACSEKAFYTPDHYYPLLYALGAAGEEDTIEVFNDCCLMGAMSMTGYLFNEIQPKND